MRNATTATGTVLFIGFSSLVFPSVHVHSWHARHRLFVAFLYAPHDFVVAVRRQHADVRHHALHESAPARRKAVVLWFLDHLVHGHHWTLHVGILRKARNGISVRCDVTTGSAHLHALHSRHVRRCAFLPHWTIACRPITGRTHTHAATQAGTVIIATGNTRLSREHAHTVFHADSCWHSPTLRSCDQSDIRRHLVHHVMRQVAMQHPVPRIVGLKLNVSGLRHSHEHGVARIPCAFRNPSGFCSGHLKRVAVQMDRVMIHS